MRACSTDSRLCDSVPVLGRFPLMRFLVMPFPQGVTALESSDRPSKKRRKLVRSLLTVFSFRSFITE